MQRSIYSGLFNGCILNKANGESIKKALGHSDLKNSPHGPSETRSHVVQQSWDACAGGVKRSKAANFRTAKINERFLIPGVVLWIQEVRVLNFTKGEILVLEMKTVTQYTGLIQQSREKKRTGLVFSSKSHFKIFTL